MKRLTLHRDDNAPVPLGFDHEASITRKLRRLNPQYGVVKSPCPGQQFLEIFLVNALESGIIQPVEFMWHKNFAGLKNVLMGMTFGNHLRQLLYYPEDRKVDNDEATELYHLLRRRCTFFYHEWSYLKGVWEPTFEELVESVRTRKVRSLDGRTAKFHAWLGDMPLLERQRSITLIQDQDETIVELISDDE